MKRTILACFALVALTAIHGLAAEPAAESKADPKQKSSPKAAAHASEQVIPRRKLTFDVSEEERLMPFNVADPELLDQRYVATFRLVGARPLRTYGVSFYSPLKGVDHSDARDRQRAIFFYGKTPSARVYNAILGEMPQERLPSEEIVSLLTKKNYPYFSSSPVRADKDAATRGEGAAKPDEYYISCSVLAPTAEQAKQLTKGVLSFYDSVSFSLQENTLAAKEAFEKELPQLRESLKQSQDESATLEKLLEGLSEYKDISQEALVNFTTQQRLISVDMQGVKARIDACNKILGGAARRLTPSLVEQLETIKLTAEIELVGLAARREALEEIVKKGREVRAAYRSRDVAKSQVLRQERELPDVLDGIAHYEAELKKCMPLPLEDGKVTIRRIKWVPPEKKD